MRLEELQRGLCEVLTTLNPPQASNDPELSEYLEEVRTSDRLHILKHCMRSWRKYDIERACPLTVAALQARGHWECTLKHFNNEPHLPFVELLAERFLEFVSQHFDPLVASVAQFERAYLAVAKGSTQQFVVRWDREPTAVLSRLVKRLPLDDGWNNVAHLTRLSRDLPNLLEITVAPSD